MLPEFADRIPVFAGDVVAKKKPAPDVYNLAATTLGVNPARCVVIEDTRIGEYISIFTFTFTFNSYFHIGNQLDTDGVFCFPRLVGGKSGGHARVRDEEYLFGKRGLRRRGCGV